MAKAFLKIKNWIKENPKETLFLGLILLAGAFLRLYKIDQYMMFLGDEGRDVIIVRRLLVNHNFFLVGPGTSVGNMYLGPLYYYLMAPALFLANFSPVGPAVQIALLGVATIFFVWFCAREWFGRAVAFIAASLYALSPTIIIYSQSSWNPNIMPFFALLSIYSIWKVWHDNHFGWLPVLGLSFAFVLQSHYLGLLLIPTLGIFWLLTFFKLRPQKVGNILQKSFLGLFIFIVLMSPLAIFDARHGWRNFFAVKTFFTSQEVVSLKTNGSLSKTWSIFENVMARLLGARVEAVGVVMAIVILVGLIWLIISKRKSLLQTPYPILFSWLGFAILGLGFYKQPIYDHYYGFFFPAPFILLGSLVSEALTIGQRRLVGKIATSILIPSAFVFLLGLNLLGSPLRNSPNRQLQRSREVANKIMQEAGGKEFDLAVIAERNYEDGYGYFLEAWGAKVLHADRWDKNTIAEQLFVVCEMPKEKCDPTHSPKAEVANFGWSKIDDEWEVGGVNLYKLVHTR